MTVGTPPFPVRFTDLSVGAPTSWSWEFGDGTTATAQNPVHVYSKLGRYQVRLTVSNPAGREPADEGALCGGGAAGGLLHLRSHLGRRAAVRCSSPIRASDAPTAWTWDFGDGGTSTAQNPSHTIRKPGRYAVTLTAGDATGANTVKMAEADRGVRLRAGLSGEAGTGPGHDAEVGQPERLAEGGGGRRCAGLQPGGRKAVRLLPGARRRAGGADPGDRLRGAGAHDAGEGAGRAHLGAELHGRGRQVPLGFPRPGYAGTRRTSG